MPESMDKIDGRIVRTRQMLRDALIGLMEEKGFEATSVSDLTSRAGLNRGTFYLHYKDKYDLLEQSKKELIEGLLPYFRRASPKLMIELASEEEANPVIISVFQYLAEHASFMKVMLGPKGDPSFPDALKQVMKEQLFEKLVELQPGNMAVPREFFLAYVTSANVGVIQHWFESGMNYSPAYMALLLTRMTRRGPLANLGFGL
ncbi:TetR/AcrR family transcriptional regulator [Paenibacillus harenae]|uniref:TetR/AcrR family transcriptional regulator n=1 Tax=Paenibacillus harenae TaxID=306543 RepID=UPI00042914CA|nr:TetR/AcrR family transcriptional regulator [Paenibacillus harenae]